MQNNLFEAAIFAATVCLLSAQARAQHDPGLRGGYENTAGELERRGIPIPHPPLISANSASGATVQVNEKALFLEGIIRAVELEGTCAICVDVTGPVVGKGELDPVCPQYHTNGTGLGTMPTDA